MNLLNRIRTARAIHLLRKAGGEVFVEIRQLKPGDRTVLGRTLKRFSGIHEADKAFETTAVRPAHYNTLHIRAVMAKMPESRKPPEPEEGFRATEFAASIMKEDQESVEEAGRQAVAAQEHGEWPATVGPLKDRRIFPPLEKIVDPPGVTTAVVDMSGEPVLPTHTCDTEGPMKAGPDDLYHASCTQCGEPVMEEAP